MFLCVLLLCLYFHVGSCQLQCFSGITGNLSTCIANVSLGEQCITVDVASRTFGYYCGNCTLGTVEFGTGVTCCNTDFCQNATLVPSKNNTCASFGDSARCTAQPSCFWCGSTVFGTGFCETQAVTLPIFPCWSLNIFPPWNNLCAPIACPPVVPAYNVTDPTYSYANLKARGLPVLPRAFGNLLAFDLYFRTLLLTFNTTGDYNCNTSAYMLAVCGSNSTSTFQYCFVSERWPQPDYYGWFQNTTPTHFGSISLFGSAICACAGNNKAFYVVNNPGVGPNYNGVCPGESVLLAMYILLLVFYAGLLLINIYDLFILAFYAYLKEDILTQPVKVKFTLILLILINMTVTAYNAGANQNEKPKGIVFGVLLLTGEILLIFVYALSLFTFTEIILVGSIEMKTREKRLMLIFKWVMIIFVVLCLIACVILLAIAYNGLAVVLIKYNVTVPELIIYAPRYNKFILILVTFLAVLNFVIMVTGFMMLMRVCQVLYHNYHRTKMDKYTKMIIIRLCILLAATVFWIPYVVLLSLGLEFVFIFSLAFFSHVVGLYCFSVWTNNQKGQWLQTAYDVTIASYWTIWALYVSEWFIIALITYSWKTLIAKSVVRKFVYNLFSQKSSSTGGDSDEAKMTSGSAVELSGSLGKKSDTH